jgi:hypothetical protein
MKRGMQKEEGRRKKFRERKRKTRRTARDHVLHTRAIGQQAALLAPWIAVIILHSSFFILPSSFAATNPPAPDAIPPLRPPRGEIAPTFWEQNGLWVAIAGVLLLAVIAAAVWWLRRTRPPVTVPPDVQARQALEPLRQQPEDGAVLSRISQVLRRYVSAAFGLPPGEMTTAEFCRAIADQGRLGTELSTRLGDFLRQCDERKFAPSVATPALGAAEQALRLLEQSEARRAELRQADEARTAPQPPRAYRGASKA